MSETRYYTENQKLIDLRQENDLLRFALSLGRVKQQEQAEIAQLQAENERLREKCRSSTERPG